MAMTLEELQKRFTEQGVSVFLAPDRPALLTSFRGINGSYQVVALLEIDGTFLQLRSLDWLHCPEGHPSLPTVLRALGDLNYTHRLVKIGWNPANGELTAYADVWIEDGTLTSGQFARFLGVYLPVMDLSYGRLQRTIATGTDPGPMRPEDLLAEAGAPAGGAGLPDKIRGVLAKLRDDGPKPPAPAPPEPATTGPADPDMI